MFLSIEENTHEDAECIFIRTHIKYSVESC